MQWNATSAQQMLDSWGTACEEASLFTDELDWGGITDQAKIADFLDLQPKAIGDKTQLAIADGPVPAGSPLDSL